MKDLNLKKNAWQLKPKIILTTAIILLFLITISIQNTISADLGDYASVAKFFAGESNTKIRSSHSYFYGFINAPFVKLTHNFVGMKIMTLVWLILLIISIYYLSGKDKKTLLLTVTAPIFWYMAPIINPIQVSSLLFLWAYHFIKEYDEEDKISNLIYSGLFVGLSWVFWDTMLYFGAILTICFLYNKKVSHLFLFIIFIFTGLIPRLILDQFLFNFPFFTIFKSFSAGIVSLLWKGIYGAGGLSPKTFPNLFPIIIIFPLFSYLLSKPKNFKENKKTIFFLILSLLLILVINPQIRYTLVIIPIILLNLGKIINKKQLKIQIIFSIIICFLVITPYLIQINYSTNVQDFSSIAKIRNLTISKENPNKIIKQDLNNIAKDFPKQKFIVGGHADSHIIIDRLYWGEEIDEFVSVQDYELFLKNKTMIFEKEFHPIPSINNKREIWIKGGISRRTDDTLNYSSLKYLISEKTETDLNGFELIKSYNLLNVFEKIS